LLVLSFSGLRFQGFVFWVGFLGNDFKGLDVNLLIPFPRQEGSGHRLAIPTVVVKRAVNGKGRVKSQAGEILAGTEVNEDHFLPFVSEGFIAPHVSTMPFVYLQGPSYRLIQ
jgi:hypothetical protein